jgi:hypothetical protein
MFFFPKTIGFPAVMACTGSEASRWHWDLSNSEAFKAATTIMMVTCIVDESEKGTENMPQNCRNLCLLTRFGYFEFLGSMKHAEVSCLGRKTYNILCIYIYIYLSISIYLYLYLCVCTCTHNLWNCPYVALKMLNIGLKVLQAQDATRAWNGFL